LGSKERWREKQWSGGGVKYRKGRENLSPKFEIQRGNATSTRTGTRKNKNFRKKKGNVVFCTRGQRDRGKRKRRLAQIRQKNIICPAKSESQDPILQSVRGGLKSKNLLRRKNIPGGTLKDVTQPKRPRNSLPPHEKVSLAGAAKKKDSPRVGRLVTSKT